MYNELLLARLKPVDGDVAAKIRWAQIYLASTGLGLLLLRAIIGRISWLAAVTRKDVAAAVLLAVLVASLPIFVLEVTFRPFVDFKPKLDMTTIFVKDDDLGWKLRPNAQDVWGAHVVKINPKGLRGPAVDYAKAAGVIRVLYLGDSVTFGSGLGNFEDTFPPLTGRVLTRRLGRAVETVNSGVPGYSPWQEHLYLAKEGIKYDPDLVVIGFVLNDVTEKFQLVKFGGTGEGALNHVYRSRLEWLLDNTSSGRFVQRLASRLRFGRDRQAGAKQKEVLDGRSLVYHSDRADVADAWKATYFDLQQIVDFCRTHKVPLLLVVFPFRFQLDDEPRPPPTPQRLLLEYGRTSGVPTLDMLPILEKAMKERGASSSDYFVDATHFSRRGNDVVAESIGAFVEQRALVGAPR